MRKVISLLWIAMLGSSLLWASGCGVDDDDFEAGNRLVSVDVTDSNGTGKFVLFAVEWTDDSGEDGQPGTGDPGEGDGFPDIPGELIIQGLNLDSAFMTLQNDPRPGVDPGVDLEVFQVNITYRKVDGTKLVIPGTPTPTFTQGRQLLVPNDGQAELEFIILPDSIKAAPGGLRDILLFGSAEEKALVDNLTAIIDVFAVDVLNDDNVHTQATVTLDLINPTASPPDE